MHTTSFFEQQKMKFYNLLRWSERYTKTDMVYFTTGGFWLNSNYIISSFFSLFILIAFARFLPKEIYGNYRYLVSLAGILGAFYLSGMNTAITQAVARGFEGSLPASFIIQLRWGFVPSLAALVGSAYYGINGNLPFALSLLIIGILYPISSSANSYVAYLSGKKDFKTSFIYLTVSQAFHFILILSAIILSKNIVYLILAYFLSDTISNLFFYFKTLKKFKPNDKHEPETVSYGKRLSVMHFLSNVATQIDSILIFNYLGAVELSLYAFAILVPERIRGLFKFIPTISLPKFSEKTSTEIRSTIIEKTIRLALVSFFAFLLYFFVSPFLYHVFFPTYAESVPYSQLFSLSLIATAAHLPVSALLSRGMKKELYLFTTISPFFQITALLILIPFYGLWGAIYAKIFSYFFNFGYSLYLVKRKI